MIKTTSLVALACLGLSALAFPSPVLGQQNGNGEDQETTVVFHWWNEGVESDWSRGGVYAALGLVGALVTMFSLIGGAVPGTAGQARIDSDGRRLELLYKRLLSLAQEAAPDAAAIEALNESVDRLRDDLRRETWRQFGIALLFYAVLGAFFASALARDLLQAIVIGAGWTGYTGVFGLKSDYRQRKQTKDEQLEAAERLVDDLQRDGHTTVGSEGVARAEPSHLATLQSELRVARAL